MVTVLIGFPASGKSTYAVDKALDGATVLSSDKIREELYGDESVQGNPAKVFSILYGKMEEAINDGAEHIIIDATNINKRDRAKAIEIAKGGNHIVRAVVMDTPIAECIRRNDARERKVPDFVFDRMLRKYEEPTLSEGFDIIERKEW